MFDLLLSVDRAVVPGIEVEQRSIPVVVTVDEVFSYEGGENEEEEGDGLAFLELNNSDNKSEYHMNYALATLSKTINSPSRVIVSFVFPLTKTA